MIHSSPASRSMKRSMGILENEEKAKSQGNAAAVFNGRAISAKPFDRVSPLLLTTLTGLGVHCSSHSVVRSLHLFRYDLAHLNVLSIGRGRRSSAKRSIGLFGRYHVCHHDLIAMGLGSLVDDKVQTTHRYKKQSSVRSR